MTSADRIAGVRASSPALTIRMHERDNVAIVANDGGLPAGTRAARRAWCCVDRVPQGHKVALVDIAAGAPVRRYGVPIGHALQATSPPAAGCTSACSRCRPRAGSTACRSPPSSRAPLPPLEGYTFEGYRNADGSVGTRNILAITRPCSAWPASSSSPCSASRPSCCRGTRTSTTWSALEHSYGCGVAIDAPDADDPDPHAAQHQPEPELRRRGDGGQPGLREAAARAAAAAGQHSRSSTSATCRRRRSRARSTWSACRTTRMSASCRWSTRSCARPRRTCERLNARRRETVPASELVVGVQCGGSDAFSRRHRQPGGRLLHRPAGARRRQRDVLRDHRGARRHRPAHRARRHARGGRRR